MTIFEIHITGEPSIIQEFENMEIKTLEVDLLNPEKKVVGKEYMCSHIIKRQNYQECKQYVANLVNQLQSKIFRIKIECPYSDEYFLDAVYAEVHWPTQDNVYPFVWNVKSKKYISTCREYEVHKFLELKRKFENVKGVEFELCLLDTNVDFDKHWVSHF
jgi:hypothetical protein